MSTKLDVQGGAMISLCEQYRYTLSRVWGSNQDAVLMIGLNPSTADATRDDPTIRRCVRFANREGYERLVMMNLFAYRATKPRDLKLAADPVGPDNDKLLVEHASRAHLVIAAWGIHGSYLGRDRAVIELLRKANIKVRCFGLAKTGHPRHPLMLRADTPLKAFSNRRLRS